MPKISSKFRNTEQTTVFATQADRRDDVLINKNISGQSYYGGNEIYLMPAIKGSFNMSLSTPRPNIGSIAPSGGQRSFYSDYLNLNTPIAQKRGISFATQVGRDNIMYNINEGNNLKNL